ncbi:MAG: tetratricopeptide repeat protein [Lentimonas sp.]
MKNILRLVLGCTLCCQMAVAQSAMKNPTSNMWNDPEFVNTFTASYGVLSAYEPEISDPEKEALRGLLQVIKNNPSGAITALEGQITPKSSAAFDFILANLYFQQGNLQKATLYYSSAVRKYPNFRRAHKNLGLVLIQEGKLKEAIPVISKSLSLGNVDGRSYGLLGYGYLTEQQYYPAEVAYRQAILMQPNVRDWKLGLARCLVETQDYDGAIALFDTLLKQEPDNVDFWLLQANAYIGKDDVMAAAQNIEVVRRMGAAQVVSLTMLGDIYMNTNNPELALSAYSDALEKSGNKNTQALMRAAKLLTQTGNFEQAQQLITQMRQQFTDNLADQDDLALLTLEAKIARANGDAEKAHTILTKIVERDALNGDALIELGDYYASIEDLARAVNRYEQAQLIAKYERPALIAHAQTLIRKGSYKESLVLLNRALGLKPDQHLADYAERIERAAR